MGEAQIRRSECKLLRKIDNSSLLHHRYGSNSLFFGTLSFRYFADFV